MASVKENELAELRRLLLTGQVSRSTKDQLPAVRRIIAYMTLGIDMSPLFPQMIMQTNTTDLAMKKLVYLYLSYYASRPGNDELALLTINTLHKDCSDTSPTVRGLALRTLCGLQAPALKEYIIPPILSGLKDQSAYVRKTAALACAKVHTLFPDVVAEVGVVDTLYDMLRDRDSMVVANAASALDEMLVQEGGIALNHTLLFYFLDRLAGFNDWHKCMILKKTLSNLQLIKESEVFDVMNNLEVHLQSANSGVVLGVGAVYLKLTESMPNIHLQVYERLRQPLLAFMQCGEAEDAFCCLKHLNIMLQRVPRLLDGYHHCFFSTEAEAEWVRCLKMDILCRMVNSASAEDIALEMAAYVRSRSLSIVDKAMRHLGTIAAEVPAATTTIYACLLEFLRTNDALLQGKAFRVLADIVRMYPLVIEEALSFLSSCIRNCCSEEYRSVCIWMAGEHGDTLDDLPYVFEPLIEQWHELSPSVQVHLLTATTKLFFKRPPEFLPLLTDIMMEIQAQPSPAYLVDRAKTFYSVLSRLDVQEAQAILLPSLEPISIFCGCLDEEIVDYMMDHFDSLSVVLGVPYEELPQYSCAVGNSVSQGRTGSNADERALDPAPTPVERKPSLPPTQPFLKVKPNPDPIYFQNQWKGLRPVGAFHWDLEQLPQLPAIEKQLEANSIGIVASGVAGGVGKLYLVAEKHEGDSTFFAEIVFSQSLDLKATVKGNNKRDVPAFVRHLISLLKPVIRKKSTQT